MSSVNPAPLRIFGWLADRSGCGYYRLALPATALANRGHKVALDGRMPDWVRDGGVDVIVGQRTCNVGASKTWQELARAGTAKLVLELDDDLWHVDPSNTQAYRFYDADHQRRLRENIAVADVVTVSTEPLAELVSAWNRNVVVLPNCIPSWLLDRHGPVECPDRLTIGWGGSPSHARDFGEIAKPLKRVLQRFGDAVEFHCMGADYTSRVASIKGRTRYSGWHDGVEDYLRAIGFHIGVIPLRPSVFNDSKSCLKLLELAALGIPAVASSTGPYKRAYEAGAPCRVVDGPRDFESSLIELVQSPQQRRELGKLARDWASTRVIDDNAHLWEEAYQ